MTARRQVVIVGEVGSVDLERRVVECSLFWRSRPERTITAQQVFVREALAASVRGGELDD